MSLLDKPVSMKELGKAVVRDLGAVSQRKLSEEKNDLSAVWESMYEKGLRRKVSTQCYLKPEDFENSELGSTQAKAAEGCEAIQETSPDELNISEETSTTKRDLASVHLDRAMNTSRARWHNEGRHYRRKRTFSKEDCKTES
ncbi:uncharacterized protein LOC116298031 [Actinia tenebrosa]|uniref:Uncharacterized protein LOC116298031 n=1 Tax=Actinia tenebrosa TaxID=6105 RepID=A0A6P8I0V2_ACTTE|nr:uncharacterized protein LOC116298031 [Actinia tenebrosa]